MEFIASHKGLIKTEMNIMNSHPEYNLLAEGKKFLTEEDLLKEHEEKLEKERYLIRADGHFVGIIEFIMKNPKDEMPWLGLLLVHKEWTRKSIGEKALLQYENMMLSRKVNKVRLGCFTENETGMRFWERNGFEKVKEIIFRNKRLWILEKEIPYD